MLTHITISNFAIVDHLSLELERGMTAITGETGAGKSIMIDALGLALGGRADSETIRAGEEKAEILACFEIDRIFAAQQWLQAHEYGDEECILRRVITKEGRSRAFINGMPVTLSELKTLGELLVDIHSQHAHQSLLKKAHHAQLLDEFANAQTLTAQVNQLTAQYRTTAETLQSLLTDQQDRAEREQLLSYQLEELDRLALQPGEVEQLEQEHRQQAQAGETLTACQHISQICSGEDDGNVLQLLGTCLHKLTDLNASFPAIDNAVEMLASAQIQVEEAVSELNRFMDSFEADPQREREIAERLSTVFDLARKHRVNPEDLIDKHEQIAIELQQVQGHDDAVLKLEQQLDSIAQQHFEVAQKLSAKRKKAAKQLEKSVTERMALLGMPKGRFTVALDEVAPRLVSAHGLESIEFLVTTNPGQPPKPLAKVASGGELSRISLAIQVIIAQTSATPTLIFDEVDVGIGGGTAEIVGSMLREVGNNGQVLCVTHQAQVASRAHHHLNVLKQHGKHSSSTRIELLEDSSRLNEVARMLGGVEITTHTLNHAQEMLAQGQR